MIQQDILLAWDGTFKKYKKNQCIFFEGQKPMFYHEIVEGSVRMVNVNEGGKEFIQGIFGKEQSFGEPVLFIDERYPATAIANEPTMLLRITKGNFLLIINEYPEIHLSFTRLLAARLFNKATIAKEISGENPEHRVITVLHMLKKNSGCTNEKKYKVELSRQRIADMTALRVETVIRTMKKLAEKGIISIEKGKVFV
jgi:CRP-like cAMP-binding protein